MRTLKRTLCLVLAMVMVLGMFGIASAASFKDDDKIQYDAAVGVMTGIGAINGMGDGTFNPAGNVTRAQAAKMVAYAVLGADVAKNLPVSASSFKDVDSNFNWAIPSIEYLVKRGVINGRGDGTFDPNGNITAYEIAKMLLCAAGYGKNGEYTGNSWMLNVAITAQKQGVFTGSKATDRSAAATREECALYCYNGLSKVDQVNWSKDEDAYVSAGKGTIATNVYGLETDTIGIITDNQATGEEDDTLVYTVTKVDADGKPTEYDKVPFAVETGLNLLGHNVKMYTNGKTGDNQVVYYVEDLSTTVTVTAPIAKAADYVKAFGEKAPAASENIIVFDATWAKTATNKATFVTNINNGSTTAQVGVYVVYNKEIVAYLPPVAETATVMGAVSKDGKTVDIGMGAAKAVDNVVYTSEVKEDDVILVRTIGTMYYVSPVATVTGQYTAKTTNALGEEVITVDGTSFTVKGATLTDNSGLASIGSLVFGETYTLYLDGYGRYFAVTADEGTTTKSDLYYVVDAFNTEVTTDATYNTKVTLTKLQVVDVNGEVSNITIDVDALVYSKKAGSAKTAEEALAAYKDTTNGYVGKTVTFTDLTLTQLKALKPDATSADLAKLKAVGFKMVEKITTAPTKDTDGVLTVKAANIDFDKDTTSLSAEQINEGKAYVNANTNYIFFDKSLADIDVTTITGGINQTIAKGDIKAVVATLDAQKNYVIKAIVFGTKSVQDADDYLFFADTTQMPVESATGKTYKFYNMAGESADYLIDKGTLPTDVGFYSYTVTDGVYSINLMDTAEYKAQVFAGAYGTNVTTKNPLTGKAVVEDYSVVGAKLVDLTEDGSRGSFTKFKGGETVFVYADTENRAVNTVFVVDPVAAPTVKLVAGATNGATITGAPVILIAGKDNAVEVTGFADGTKDTIKFTVTAADGSTVIAKTVNDTSYDGSDLDLGTEAGTVTYKITVIVNDNAGITSVYTYTTTVTVS